MQNKILKLLLVVFLLGFVFILMGTRGYKKIHTGASGSGGIVSISKYVEGPAIETFETIHHFLTAATADSIWCQCRGSSTPTITMQWDNDTTNVDNSSIVCDADDEDDTNLQGDPTFDVGSDLDLKITATNGNITDCTFIIYFE